jgi:acetyl-CoA carboxylase biotin carboxyl carrier protein
LRDNAAVGLSRQELMSLMERFDQLGLDELVLDMDGTRVELTSSGNPPVVETNGSTASPERHDVLAPSVGIVRLPSPKGSEVGPEDVVCVLEVWTSTVEVAAGVRGTVAEVQVAEGTLVEYGQLLLSIEPA